MSYCDCKPLALALLQDGLFPYAPIRPSFAFDINHLLFVSTLFLNLCPNITAWCSTLACRLKARGYCLLAEVSSWGFALVLCC